MRTRILNYLRSQHLGLIALILVVAGGSAYAAALAKNSVKSKQIKDGQVRSIDVADQGLTATDIADGTIGNPELGDGAVTSAKIANGEIGGADVADGAIGSAKIADGAVGGAAIADGAVGGAAIADGAVGGAAIADGAVGGSEIADSAIGASEIIDGSVGALDLDANTVGDVISRAGSFPNDAVLRALVSVNGFGVLKAACSAANSLNVSYSLNSPVSQTAHLFVHDPTDNAPSNQVATAGTAGTGGVQTAGYALAEGEIWSFTPDRVLEMDLLINQTANACVFRVRATLDHNEP